MGRKFTRLIWLAVILIFLACTSIIVYHAILAEYVNHFDLIPGSNGNCQIPSPYYSTRYSSNDHYSKSMGKNQGRTAFIIPYRDRFSQLQTLLRTLHPFLASKKEGFAYDIFVVEQLDSKVFNKGKLMNIAFDYIMNLSFQTSKNSFLSTTENPNLDELHKHYSCFVFHDVDLILENGGDSSKSWLYHCSCTGPLHISSAIDEMGYRLMYPSLVGGVLAFTPDQFIRVNGYSNLYVGWGAEDDDMSWRIRDAGMKIVHLPLSAGRFRMIPHAKRIKWKRKNQLLAYWNRWRYDGLNSIRNARALLEYPQNRRVLDLLKESNLWTYDNLSVNSDDYSRHMEAAPERNNQKSGLNHFPVTHRRDNILFNDKYIVKAFNNTRDNYINISVTFI